VLVPGMGDLRATYRFLAPALQAAGCRVACTDLRGHGDSDISFASYGDAESAGDITELIGELGGPAVLVGNSMGAAAATLAAAERPDLVAGLVLIGPFLRDPQVNLAVRILMRVAMARPWLTTTWKSYLPKLYAGTKPADFDAYRDRVVANLRRTGYATAFSKTARTSHDRVEARLADVSAPAIVIMGALDPDFADPRAEADWIAGAIGAEVVMVPEAGHYPQSQQPGVTAGSVIAFVKRVRARA
jgi:pimeloyl-ACP methyl ester carboxylesterase